MRYLFILLIVANIANNVNGQGNTRIRFKHYSANEGLSSNRISAILQDSYEYMWFGTIDGLNKFDGYEFQVYRYDPLSPSNNLGSSYISALHEDGNRNLWVGCLGAGLYKYNRAYDNFEKAKESGINQAQRIFCIYTTSDGTMLLGSEDQGLQIYDQETGASLLVGLKGEVIRNIYEDKKGDLWVATASDLYLANLSEEKFTNVIKDPNLAYSFFNPDGAVFFEDDGFVWVGCKKGLLKFSVNDKSSYLHYSHEEGKNSLSHSSVFGIQKAFGEKLWVSTSKGLNLFDPAEESFQHFLHDDFDQSTISINSLNYMYKDDEENVWIGSWSNGINYFNPNNTENTIRHYKKGIDEKSLGHNVVSAFAEAQNGDVWIGTIRGGMDYFNRKGGSFEHYTEGEGNSLSQDIIRALYVDLDGILWIGTFRAGLDRYNADSGIFQNYNRLLEDKDIPPEILSLQDDSEGSLYIGTREDGVIVFDKQQGKPVKNIRYQEGNENSLSHNEVWSIVVNKNNLWLATGYGLNQINLKTFQNKVFLADASQKGSLSNNVTSSLHIDADERLWVGTGGGGLNLFVEESGTFITYSTKDGLANDFINGIEDDNNGNIWISTNKGISRLKIDEEGKLLHYDNYDNKDGLQSNIFLPGASLKTRRGDLVFGGNKGFNIFHPDSLKVNTKEPVLHFTGVKLFNEPVEISSDTNETVLKKHISELESISFNYKQSNFTFTFVGLNYSHPEKNTYFVKMDGYEKDWVNIGNKREATYSNLPAGKYTFMLKAANNDGLETSTPISIKVVVKPPFWKTWPFRIVLLMILFWVIYFFYKKRMDMIKHDQEVLQQKIKEGEHVIDQKVEEVEHQKEEMKKRDEEEREMRFTNIGISRFSEITSSSRDDINEMSQKAIAEIVHHVGAVMGVLYVYQDDSVDNLHLDLSGAYAVGEISWERKHVKLGVGYVGTCFKEGKTIVVEDVPESYHKLVSGLGATKPKLICVVPIKQSENIQGVIEIGSLKELEKYKIDYIEKVAETITSIISIKKTSKRMNDLLELSNQQTEELRSQEEEMRQNMEEMLATQEEMRRREEKWEIEKKNNLNKIAQLKEEIEKLHKEIDDIRGDEEFT